MKLVLYFALLFSCGYLNFHVPGVSAEDCVPMEKEVLLISWRNEGNSESTHSHTATVGKSKSKSTTQGSSTSNTQTSDSETSSSHGASGGGGLNVGVFNANAGYNYQKAFSQRLGTSATSNYNWDETDSSVFNEESSRTDTHICKARTHCFLYQLVGVCGDMEFKAPFTIFREKPIVAQTTARPARPDGLPRVEITNRPGETWIIAKNLTFLNHTGNWEKTEVCAPSSFVSEFRTKSSADNGTGLSGFSLKCSTRTEDSDFEGKSDIKSGVGPTGTWYSPFRSSSKRHYANGFVSQEWTGKDGRRYKGNWKLLFHNQPSYLFLPKKSTSVTTHKITCPDDQAVCGIQTMMDDVSQSVITNIGLKCCYYCIPVQEYEVKDAFENKLSKEMQHTTTLTVGTKKESTSSSGGQRSTDQSVTTEGQLLSGVQAGFAATFGSSSSEGFNWGSTDSTSWSSESTTTFNWACSAKHKCTVRQLVGKCGSFRIQTNYRIIDEVPLSSPNSNNNNGNGNQEGSSEAGEGDQQYEEE